MAWLVTVQGVVATIPNGRKANSRATCTVDIVSIPWKLLVAYVDLPMIEILKSLNAKWITVYFLSS